jgi:hypothetical protein
MRLETPEAENALRQALEKAESQKLEERDGREVEPARLKTALAHVRARDMKGMARASQVARSVDLSWNEVKMLSQRVSGAKRTELQGGRGDKIVDDVTDSVRHGEKR